MIDPGYSSWQDPRLQPPDEVGEDGCVDCAFYRDVCSRQASNGRVHCVGVCVYEVYHARNPDQLEDAELAVADPYDEPCREFMAREDAARQRAGRR